MLYPKSTHDIKQALIFSHEYKIPLTVCGGLSAGTGGGLTEGILIDLRKHYNKIRQVNMVEQTVTVDAGAQSKDLLEKLKEWNLDLPVLQREDPFSTIGGELATKSCSQSTFKEGTIREWVESITVILDSGEEHTIQDGVIPSGRLLSIYQAVFPFITVHAPEIRADKPNNAEDASGYNLWSTAIGPRQLLDQIIGSEGTLAIITQVTFRLCPLKAKRTSIAVSFNDTQAPIEVSTKLKELGCSSLFYFDQNYEMLASKASNLLLLGNTQAKHHIVASFYEDSPEKLLRKIHKHIPTSGVEFALSNNETAEHISLEHFMRHTVDAYSKKNPSACPPCTRPCLFSR